jgi:glutathione peroxidase
MSSPIYDFVCLNINNEPIKLADFQDKVLLVVNTASLCGFTPQYKGLEQLYREYKSKGFVLLGFPSNQFGEEPFDNERINNFCIQNYGVSFPMFSKVHVNGKNAEPLFTYLKKEKSGLFGMRRLNYNFTKFLIDREGNVIKRFSPLTFPHKIRGAIDELL